MIEQEKGTPQEKWYLKYSYEALRDTITKKIVTIYTEKWILPSQHKVEIADLSEQIRDKISIIKPDNRELALILEDALNSILKWFTYNKVNIWSDLVDVATLLNPVLSVITSLSILPTAIHKYFYLNPNLKSVDKALQDREIKQFKLHSPWYLEEVSEALDVLVEVVLKVLISSAIPKGYQIPLPFIEVLVSLNTAKDLYNSLVVLDQICDFIIQQEKDSN